MIDPTERVAEAMWNTHIGDFPPWDEAPEDDRGLYRALARAAIGALPISARSPLLPGYEVWLVGPWEQRGEQQ